MFRKSCYSTNINLKFLVQLFFRLKVKRVCMNTSKVRGRVFQYQGAIDFLQKKVKIDSIFMSPKNSSENLLLSIFRKRK